MHSELLKRKDKWILYKERFIEGGVKFISSKWKWKFNIFWRRCSWERIKFDDEIEVHITEKSQEKLYINKISFTVLTNGIGFTSMRLRSKWITKNMRQFREQVEKVTILMEQMKDLIHFQLKHFYQSTFVYFGEAERKKCVWSTYSL